MYKTVLFDLDGTLLNIADVVASYNKGQIMKAVMPELKGKAEGSVINQVVAKLCQA